MTRRELRYEDLDISLTEVYEEMGYRNGAVPDAATAAETEALVAEVRPWLRPRFAFTVKNGELIDNSQLSIPARYPSPVTQHLSPITFHPSSIISRQLKGSEAFAFFVATAGAEYETFQQRLTREGDMMRVFVANALGTVIVEKCADKMELFLQSSIDKLGWKHTNRFSPGYCNWHVSEQHLLFSIFDEEAPCGIHLTDSSLMVPIKSVSGIIGVGKNVRKNEYSCGRCDFDQCYKRRKLT